MQKYITQVLGFLAVFSLPFFARAEIDNSQVTPVDPVISVMNARIDSHSGSTQKLKALTNLRRQYTFKLRQAQRKRDTQGITEYQGVLDALVTKEKSLKNTLEYPLLVDPSTSTGTLTNTGTTASGSLAPVSSQAEEARRSQIRNDVKNMYNSNGGSSQSKSFFLRYFASEYGMSSYYYEYASSLEYKNQ